MPRLLGFLALALLAVPALAQEPLTEHTLTRSDTLARPPATLDDLAWLIGTWRGPGLGGMMEEVWMPPAGGAMPGLFRLVKDDEPIFYEFWAMREIEGTLVLELKHFNPDMTAWEEKDELVRFHLVRMEEDTAYFGGLTYQRVDDDTLQIWLAMRGRDGTTREMDFTLRRHPLRP